MALTTPQLSNVPFTNDLWSAPNLHGMSFTEPQLSTPIEPTPPLPEITEGQGYPIGIEGVGGGE